MSNMANLSKEGLVIVAMISGVFMAVLLGMGMMKTVFGNNHVVDYTKMQFVETYIDENTGKKGNVYVCSNNEDKTFKVLFSQLKEFSNTDLKTFEAFSCGNHDYIENLTLKWIESLEDKPDNN